MVQNPLTNSGVPADQDGAGLNADQQAFESAGQDEAGVAHAPQIDAAKAAAMFAELVARQNLLLGILGGLAGALFGALLWAVITAITRYQIGYMAIGVGFLVGIAVRYTGNGLTTKFGIVGAVFALLGCVLGNIWAMCGMAAIDAGQPVIGLTMSVMSQPSLMVELMQETFSPMDVVFYGIALFQGYKLSFRELSDSELAQLTS